MKKVGIVTITGYRNYGNMLQNYATQEVLKDLGFHAVTIDNAVVPTAFAIKPPIGKLTILQKKIDRWIHRERIKEYQELNHKKEKVFKAFKDAHIEHTDYVMSENDVPDGLADSFDFFVTGSDQVWNPYYRLGSGIDFLTFAPPEKRVAYSPSFGISEIPESIRGQYGVWLREMHRLSVREESGARIIKELTGRDAPVLIDPTLMLAKERWLSVAEEPAGRPDRKYMLTYFLGVIPRRYKDAIKRIAAENDLKIVSLADIREKEHYVTGPGEFIDYFHAAAIVITDSFHGSVFSILLERPFLVLNRMGNVAKINSRIETLLSLFGLESRKFEQQPSNEDLFHIDFSHIAGRLESERKKAVGYLREALRA